MKKLSITLAICSIITLANAATWKFHIIPDCWVDIYVQGLPEECNGQQWVMWGSGVQSDLAWDEAFPASAYTGTYTGQRSCGNAFTETRTNGWADPFIIVTPDAFGDAGYWITGPYPDYSGGGGGALPAPNEYWVDFDASGSVRFSLNKPEDFGKWAWDGSINPLWVEPPVALKTNHGKKHRK